MCLYNDLFHQTAAVQHLFFSVVCFYFYFLPSSPLREIVLKLLQYEASTNVADNKGYFPIHLAAWKGDEEIVKILIHHGPSRSRVNEQVRRPGRAPRRQSQGRRASSLRARWNMHSENVGCLWLYPAQDSSTAEFSEGQFEKFFGLCV